MLLETLCWSPEAGWSAELPTTLDSPQTLVVAFADPSLAHDERPLRELRAALGASKLVGCSTAGQIYGDSITDGTLVASVARFEETRVELATARLAHAGESTSAGKRIAAALGGPDLRAVFVLCDGLAVNGSELVRGLTTALPNVVVSGGLAGDGDRFQQTWVIAGGDRLTSSVVAVGLYGPAVEFHTGSYGGWGIFGPERLVTRSEHNVLHELDGKPALALYKAYLGERASELPAAALRFPLAVRSGRGEPRRTVRTVLAVDDRDQSMTFAGNVPEGWLAQLMCTNADRLVDGAMQAAAMSAVGAHSSPQLAVAISCVGRRLLLGERTEEEIEATLEALPATSQLVGFYSYGEIAPHPDGLCDLHNQTMTVTTIGER